MTARATRYSAIFLLCSAVFLCEPAGSQQPSDKPPVANQSFSPLRSTSNVVVVRVVVRDAQGKPVEGLKREDFRLFDQGKEQAITAFDSEAGNANSAAPPVAASPTTSPGNSVSVSMTGQAGSRLAAALPGKFLALYFDDLDTSEADMTCARHAGEQYVAAHLQPEDRVAVFTSDQMLSDFTSDRKQIDAALSKVHASARALNVGNRNCPNLSDYQALQIMQNQFNQTTDAWKLALDEAPHCEGGFGAAPQSQASNGNPTGIKGGATSNSEQQFAVSMVLQVASYIVNQTEVQVRANVQQLGQVVKYVSQMPGQRTVILVSPGFLTQDEQVPLDRVVDHALRSQVVISSLDPKGLALQMRESDASERYFPSATGGVLSASHRIDSERETFATAVLAEVADSTGGEYVHDQNDLKAGLAALAGSPAYYTLGFAPSDMKPNGKFHELKVRLAENDRHYTVQARRGYFAPANEAEAEAEAKERDAADAEAQRQEELRETIFSSGDVTQIPVSLKVNVSRRQSEAHAVSLSTHVDAQSLQLSKDGDHNLDTVKFYFVVFDQKGNVVANQMRQAKLDITDAQLSDLFKVGLDLNVGFPLSPGTYRVREVVTESGGPKTGALSRNVEVPAHDKVLKASLLGWDPPDVDSAVPSHPSATCSLPDVLKLAAARANELVENLRNFDAHEQIRYEQTNPVGGGLMSINANFDYQVDFGREAGNLKVQEVRTALPGTDTSLKASVSDNGLPVLALIFDPALQSDYEMRCDGLTQWNQYPAWLVYFRQLDGKRPRTAAIPAAAKIHPVSLKGRAWIAAGSGQVMHIETNLVKGLALLSTQSENPIFIRGNSVSVDYGPVQFKSRNIELWLPQSATTFTDYGDRRMIIQHIFSNFQLFSVQTHQVTQSPQL